MRILFLGLLLSLGGWSQDEPPLPPAQPPQLTAQEERDGWQLLFDGRTWKHWSLSKLRESGWWRIDHGWIRSRAKGDGEGRRLFTLDSFENFDLQFDWRIEPEGNSGVKYRIQQASLEPKDVDPDQANARRQLLPPSLENVQEGYAVGFEYQLTDDERAPDALDSPARSTAALYRLATPRKAGSVKARTDHHSRIRVVGWHFEHWLDGVKVLEGDLSGEAIQSNARANRAMAQVKLEQAANARERYDARVVQLTAEALIDPRISASPIDFQHHRSGVAFKNIKIRRLN